MTPAYFSSFAPTAPSVGNVSSPFLHAQALSIFQDPDQKPTLPPEYFSRFPQDKRMIPPFFKFPHHFIHASPQLIYKNITFGLK